MTRTRLETLAEIAAMLRDAELARLQKLERDRSEIEEQRQALHRDRIRAMASLEPDPARMAGADIRWQGWAAGQMHALAIRETSAAAAAERQKVEARRAFGRADVLARLAKAAQQTRKG